MALNVKVVNFPDNTGSTPVDLTPVVAALGRIETAVIALTVAITAGGGEGDGGVTQEQEDEIMAKMQALRAKLAGVQPD